MSLSRAAKLAATLAFPLVLTACGADPVPRGYVLDQQALAQIKVGSSAEQVILVLGTPSVVSTVGGKGYYYVSQTTSQYYQFMSSNIIEQRVLAVHLDGKNRVERIANYGMQDGRVFDFISRTTPTGGDELTFLRQLMRASNFLAPSSGGGAKQPGQ